jgi:predicted PurR-regulated permease PerM
MTALPDPEQQVVVEPATATRRKDVHPTRDRSYPRLFGVAALGLLGWVLFRIFALFLEPILWSVLLAFLLQPWNTGLKRRVRDRAGVAAGLLTVGAALCVILPAAVLGAALPEQVAQLLARVAEEAKRLQIERPSDLFRLGPIASAVDWLRAHFSVTPVELQAWARQGARRLLEQVASHGGSLLAGALGFLLNLVLTLFLLFFFLRDGTAMIDRLDRAVPLPRARKQKLANQIASVTKAVVLGTLVTAIIQGALIAIAFAVVGFPSPIAFGAIAAAAALLPVGGTALVWAPGAIVLAAQGRWPWAIGLAIWGAVVVGTADNFIKPRLVSGRADIGTLPVFLGVLGGLAAFGLIGAILGPVVIALTLVLLSWAEEGNPGPA